MSELVEPVHDVDDYYDGPRGGVADYRGRPHRFRSLYLDSEIWNSDEDRFELTPLEDGVPSRESFVIRGEFRVREPAPDLPLGTIRPMEVRWFPAS